MKIKAKYQITWEPDQNFYEGTREISVPDDFQRLSYQAQCERATDLVYDLVRGDCEPADFWVWGVDPV